MPATALISGLDLVEISRFLDINPAIKQRFFKRVFTPREQQYIGDAMQRAAGIFAAKEAVVKALGCGIGPISWQEIEINHDPLGKPSLRLIGAAEEISRQQKIKTWSLSITHTRHIAGAVAVAMK